jgi:hypothetical protein
MLYIIYSNSRLLICGSMQRITDTVEFVSISMLTNLNTTPAHGIRAARWARHIFIFTPRYGIPNLNRTFRSNSLLGSGMGLGQTYPNRAHYSPVPHHWIRLHFHAYWARRGLLRCAVSGSNFKQADNSAHFNGLLRSVLNIRWRIMKYEWSKRL